MTGPFKFVRAIAPALFAGGSLCAAALGTTIPGSPPRIAPPCSPDGACLPRYETWGWYETRWRPFPGDSIAATPTPAGGQQPRGGRPLESLGGPLPPAAGQEGQIGPRRQRGQGDQGATPEPTLPDAGIGPVPGGVLPPVNEPGSNILPPVPQVIPDAAFPEPATPDAAPAPLPGTTPEIDPFGAVPSPPAWMAGQANFAPLPAAMPLYNAMPAQAPAVQDGPNLHGDDAPPSLPAGLQELLGSVPAVRPGGAPAPMAVALQQPSSVRQSPRAVAAGRGVMQASARTPLGIPLINPASAVAAEVSDDGLQQAIYFEASDHPAGAAAALPPVNSGN